jgi:hypothetical protein
MHEWYEKGYLCIKSQNRLSKAAPFLHDTSAVCLIKSHWHNIGKRRKVL